jgi:hypothetical protein
MRCGVITPSPLQGTPPWQGESFCFAPMGLGLCVCSGSGGFTTGYCIVSLRDWLIDG